LASAGGHVIHFDIKQIPVLTGAGKGVIGIHLGKGDVCLGGALIGNRHDALVVETSGGQAKEFRRGAHPAVNRGGKGEVVVKRASLVRVLPRPIELTDWDALDGKAEKPRERPPEANGEANGKTLFE